MSTSSADLFNRFTRRIQNGQWTLKNVSIAHAKKYLVKRDLEQCYQGLFLQAVVSFELLIEELFLHLITNRASHPRSSTPIHVFPSIEIARKVVTQGRYTDWLPIDKTEKLSKVFFEISGNPFLYLSKAQKNEIEKVLLIRNYIAHKSGFAYNAYETKVVSPTVLPRGQRTLLGYFEFPHTSSTNKYEYHVGELVAAARSLCM